MIYFVQPTDGGPIKIGHSGDVDARVRQLESHYGRPLAVLATMPGGREEEAEIHARFDHLRLDGNGSRGVRPEQFKPGPDLMLFIGLPLFVNQGDVSLMPAGVPVRLDRKLATWARGIARTRGISIGEYLSGITEATIKRDWGKTLREMGDEDDGSGA